MTTEVTFYILPATDAHKEHEPTASPSEVPAHFDLACRLAAWHWRRGERLFIHTDDKAAACLVDEHLWQFEPDSFVPHSLASEVAVAPVEIGFGQAPRGARMRLINLARQLPEFAGRFGRIIDFVPADTELKQQARTRYRLCQQAGFRLSTQDLSKEPLSLDELRED